MQNPGLRPATDSVAWLLRPEAVRERCERIFAAGVAGDLEHFALALDELEGAAARVVDVMRRSYPELQIPLHSRWNHFHAGGIDRLAWLSRQMEAAQLSDDERTRTKIDLVVTSVLLDAGAGDSWRYVEPETNFTAARSEGLAVASYHLFASGAFSDCAGSPLRAEASGLSAIDTEVLGRAFQVSPENPLAGLDGRAELLRRLGKTLADLPEVFGSNSPRVGKLLDYLRECAPRNHITAADLGATVIRVFAPLWPGRIALAGTTLGDVWRHPAAGGSGANRGLVPFHKLSQWLTYSLVEPLTEAGFNIADMDGLTGLAEYRNGGLFIDTGVVAPRHKGVTALPHEVGAEIIVEWRALTVALLDRIAVEIRRRLNLDAEELPLGKILEGGTWQAGREIARELRGGAPPLCIVSDGTVF